MIKLSQKLQYRFILSSSRISYITFSVSLIHTAFHSAYDQHHSLCLPLSIDLPIAKPLSQSPFSLLGAPSSAPISPRLGFTAVYFVLFPSSPLLFHLYTPYQALMYGSFRGIGVWMYHTIFPG